jgi:hypothetical protein
MHLLVFIFIYQGIFTVWINFDGNYYNLTFFKVCPQALDTESFYPFKGNMDLEKMKAFIKFTGLFYTLTEAK